MGNEYKVIGIMETQLGNYYHEIISYFRKTTG